MATNYPGSLDAWSNPTSTTALDATGFEHDLVHSNLNDAVEAIEGELGTDPAGGAATVKARLDVMELRAYRWPSTGYYYRGLPASTSGGTVTVTANRLYYSPFYCPTAVTISALTVDVTTAATGNVRMGIYAATWGSTGLVPGSLVVDAGTASTSDTTGLKEVASTQSLTADTWYFPAAVFDATPVCRGFSATSVASSHCLDNNNATFLSGIAYQSHTYGSLPSSPGTLIYPGSATGVMVMVKL